MPGAAPENVAVLSTGIPGPRPAELGQHANRLVPERVEICACGCPGRVARPELDGQFGQPGEFPGASGLTGQPCEQRVEAGGQVGEEPQPLGGRRVLGQSQRGDLISHLIAGREQPRVTVAFDAISAEA